MNLAKAGSIGLSFAIENENGKAFKLLLCAGANVNKKPDPIPGLWISPLSMAARMGNMEAAKTLLYRGANVNARDEKGVASNTPRRPVCGSENGQAACPVWGGS